MSILVFNAGSSTLKFSLFDESAQQTLAAGGIAWKTEHQEATRTLRRPNQKPVSTQVRVPDYQTAVKQCLDLLEETQLATPQRPIEAVGHRVVHGGTVFREPVRIDEQVKNTIRELAELAPLHNPPALEAIEATENALPGLPQTAMFDTAFFTNLPPHAYLYPLPYQWYSDWGIRRFGFHGISHAYCSQRATELLGSRAELRLVICHLGNGCSATAVKNGQAIATTMGFTPLEGLMMGSRCGSIDPGVLLHVLRDRGLTPEQLDHALNHESGLLGVSGVSSDFRQVKEAADQGNEQAKLALKMYADRVRATVGSLVVTLGGIEALVFTAGVGENVSWLRAEVCAGLQCVGLSLDQERNDKCRPDADIAEAASVGRILVLHTQEEQLIARETRRLLS